jgi:hypothetical protein
MLLSEAIAFCLLVHKRLETAIDAAEFSARAGMIYK